MIANEFISRKKGLFWGSSVSWLQKREDILVFPQ